MVKTYQKFKPQGCEIVSIYLQKKKKKWADAVKKDALEWASFCDFEVWDNKASLIYGVYEIPDNFLIDKNGEIVARNIHGEELNIKLAELTK